MIIETCINFRLCERLNARSQTERENVSKQDISYVSTLKINENNNFVRVHAQSIHSFNVNTSIFLHTRLNAQKALFLSVYMRFRKFLSAWVAPREIFLRLSRTA
jgi:hypothetical protein